ncbi:MAG: TolC family protein [Candidatus Zixiibacteriota bacterium]|nr:MAG: TolC family protein [candidate division Zixibacteria bacterium]
MKTLPRRKRKSQAAFGIHILWLSVALLLWSSVGAEQLTLERALEIASSNSPTMRQATYNLEASEHSLKAQQAGLKLQFNLDLTPIRLARGQVWSDRFSEWFANDLKNSSARFSMSQPIKWVDGTLSFTKTLDWRESSSLGISTTTYQQSLSLAYNQPLFTYNRTSMQLRELELELENAQLNHAIQKLRIELDVTESFLNLYHQHQRVQIERESYGNASESYDIINNKVSAGIVAREELLQADITRATSRSSLQNAEIGYENARDNFRILIGLDLAEEFEVVADIEKSIVQVNLVDAVNHGLQNRMELRQADIEIQNALFNLTRAGAENEFKASVDLSYGLSGTGSTLSEAYRKPPQDRSVAVSVQIPLFDWGQKEHRMAASQSQVDSRRLSAEEQRRQIVAQINQTYRRLQNQQTQIEIAEKNVENARLTYEINLERYRNGELSSKDIAFYQNQLSDARLQEVRALIDYKIALLDLKIRSLWDFENNRAVLESE